MKNSKQLLPIRYGTVLQTHMIPMSETLDPLPMAPERTTSLSRCRASHDDYFHLWFIENGRVTYPYNSFIHAGFFEVHQEDLKYFGRLDKAIAAFGVVSGN